MQEGHDKAIDISNIKLDDIRTRIITKTLQTYSHLMNPTRAQYQPDWAAPGRPHTRLCFPAGKTRCLRDFRRAIADLNRESNPNLQADMRPIVGKGQRTIVQVGAGIGVG